MSASQPIHQVPAAGEWPSTSSTPICPPQAASSPGRVQHRQPPRVRVRSPARYGLVPGLNDSQTGCLYVSRHTVNCRDGTCTMFWINRCRDHPKLCPQTITTDVMGNGFWQKTGHGGGTRPDATQPGNLPSRRRAVPDLWPTPDSQAIRNSPGPPSIQLRQGFGERRAESRTHR